MIVMKFGGTSVANAERIRAISDIIKSQLGNKPIVISSALGKTTDLLIDAGEKALAGSPNIDNIINQHKQTAEELNLSTESIESLLDELKELISGISQINEISDRTHARLVSYGERLATRLIADYLNSQNVPAKAYDSWDVGMITDCAHTDAQPSR